LRLIDDFVSVFGPPISLRTLHKYHPEVEYNFGSGGKMSIEPVKLKRREIAPHKALVTPLLNSRNVLTNSPWTFVALWLQRNHKPKALFYWEQAQEFHKVSVGLPLRSAPLLLYYCFMNLVKALLVAKGVSFDEMHGVSVFPKIVPGANRPFAREGVKIHSKGILPSLSSYYGETEPKQIHTLQELFFNMVFIHRTYCLTYSSQTEMFLPLANCGYVYDTSTKEVMFTADITKNIPFNVAVKRLLPAFAAAPNIGPRAVRSRTSMHWRKPGRPTTVNIQHLINFNRALREDLHFINGAQTLWYLKTTVGGARNIKEAITNPNPRAFPSRDYAGAAR
jgi:hypothetical protein